MSSTTFTAPPAATSTGASGSGGGGGGGTSPLLFFVALGFGVVFTNLWIIVGVKYCFRYNQRNRALRALAENGEPIDLTQMPRPHRRRREKKLMSMEQVNERFPLIKYKAWCAAREAQGLPTAGGVDPSSRPASLKDVDIDAEASPGDRQSTDVARPPTALDMAREDHAQAVAQARQSIDVVAVAPASAAQTVSRPDGEKVPEKGVLERSATAHSTLSNVNDVREVPPTPGVQLDEGDGEYEDDDDPIRTAAAPEFFAPAGDSCAICIDTLDNEDDVRGLTCGHAFHAACVDPWLTSRRACCPLCKADYFVPKARLEGDDATHTTALGGRQGPSDAGVPQSPAPAWIGSRGLMSFRPRRTTAASSPFSRRNIRVVAPPSSSVPATTSQPQGGSEPSSTNSWRSLVTMPGFRRPRLGRRAQPVQQPANSRVDGDGATSPAAHGPVEELPISARDLESGLHQ